MVFVKFKKIFFRYENLHCLVKLQLHRSVTTSIPESPLNTPWAYIQRTNLNGMYFYFYYFCGEGGEGGVYIREAYIWEEKHLHLQFVKCIAFLSFFPDFLIISIHKG